MVWFLMLRKEISAEDINLEDITVEDKNLGKGWDCPGTKRLEGDPGPTLKEHQYLKDWEIQKNPQIEQEKPEDGSMTEVTRRAYLKKELVISVTRG